MRRATAFLLAIACTSPSAAWVDKRGERLPDTSSRKSSGDLVAQMIFVGDEQGLFRAWSRPSESVKVEEIDSISIDSPISTFVVFGGCKADAQDNCNVDMRFRVIGPDGKVYAETPAMEVWQQKTLPPNRSLQLSVEYLKIIVEPHELRGRYTVNTEVRDINAGSSVRLQKVFTAIDRAAK